MRIAYDGAPFHGFAPNPGVVTVAATLSSCLEKILRRPVEITCAGRTDAGVHAWGQVVSFDVDDGDGRLDSVRLRGALNKMCGPSIAVRDVVVVDARFDARFSASSRLYRYTLVNRPVPDPFMARTSWWIPNHLELNAMRLGIDPLIGEHDFSAFCRRPAEDPDRGPRSLVRRVLDARWTDHGGGVLWFEIEATAFCHQMVRSITGTLVDVGLGRLSAGDVSGILRSRDRGAAGTVAPPQGLCLREVRYGGGWDDLWSNCP